MKTEHLPTAAAVVLPDLSLLNICIVLVSFTGLIIGLHRICPIKINSGFFLNNGVPLVMLILALYLIQKRANHQSYVDWGVHTARFAGNYSTLIALLCGVMGSSIILMGLYQKEIVEFLLKHHVIAPALATLLVASPNSVMGIIKGMWSNQMLQPSFLCFLQTASLASFPLFLIRKMGFNQPEITTKMYIYGLILSGISLVLMHPITAATNVIYGHWMGLDKWLEALWFDLKTSVAVNAAFVLGLLGF